MLQDGIMRKPFARQYRCILDPALEGCESGNVLEKESLIPYGTIQRYQFQSLLNAAETVEPRSECSECFIVALAESLDCLRNVFIRERRIMPDAQLKGQQLVVRACIGMFL